MGASLVSGGGGFQDAPQSREVVEGTVLFGYLPWPPVCSPLLFPFHWTNTVVKLSAFSTLLGLHQGMHCLSCFSEQTWAHGLPLSRPRSVCLPRRPGRSFISPCIEGRPPASCACPCCADPRAYGQSLWKNGVEKILRVEAAHFHLWSFPSQRTFTVKTELSL